MEGMVYILRENDEHNLASLPLKPYAAQDKG